jgi:hypothetical protein
MIAAHQGNRRSFELMIQYGGDVNKIEPDKQSIMSLLVEQVIKTFNFISVHLVEARNEMLKKIELAVKEGAHSSEVPFLPWKPHEETIWAVACRYPRIKEAILKGVAERQAHAARRKIAIIHRRISSAE